MITTDIINSSLNKTEKIKKLLDLGLTRKEIAQLLNIGYGFVQNVYAKHIGVSRNNQRAGQLLGKYGIEIEAFFHNGTSKRDLANALQQAGVNCTTEGYNHITRQHWKIVTDNSIKSNRYRNIEAFEIVSPVLQGEAGLNELQKVCEVLARLGAELNRSTGLHIHLDAEGFDLQTWKNLFWNYAQYEIAIDAFMPRSRRVNNNAYCQSVNNGQLLAKIESKTTIQDLANCVGTRYYKINAQAYLRHKSVEFRHHSGTIEFAKIKNWLYFLHHLVRFSQTQRTQNSNLTAMAEFAPAEIITFYQQRTEELN
jgi:hypothetical protein